MSGRDSQQSKVYAAEDSAFNRCAPPTMETVAEVEAYVAKIIGSAWFKKHYRSVRQIKVHDGRRHRRAVAYAGWGGPATIAMPRWSRSEWVILHEIAHLATGVVHGHGWRFCQTYLALVQHFLGKEKAARLKVEFKTRRVRYSKPRAKRALTPEQKAVLVERMAIARAAKAARVESTA